MKKLVSVFPAMVIVFMMISGCQKNSYDFDSLPPLVKSFFTHNGANPVEIGEAIQFTNASENAESFTWNFGDGTVTSETNPTKSFSEPGIYTVKLTAVGQGGTGNYSVDIVVIDPNAAVESDSELFFIEYGSALVRKLSLVPGSSVETVADMDGMEGHGMAYDAVNKKIYYADFQTTNAGKVWRMNPDGTELEELLSGLNSPYGVAINIAENKMYIVDGPHVSRADLDGSNFEKEFITIPGGLMRAVGYNSTTGLIYFYEVNDENLYVAKSDGTGIAAIVQGAYGYGLFIDETNEKIYYDDRRNSGLMMANLDGSGAVKIADFSGNRGGSGVTIDYQAEKLYWAETNHGNIKRANLDGSGAETVLSGVRNPRGMFIR